MTIDLLQNAIVLFVSNSVRRVVAAARFVKEFEASVDAREKLSARMSSSVARAEELPVPANVLSKLVVVSSRVLLAWTVGREKSLKAICARVNGSFVSSARAARRSVRRAWSPEGGAAVVDREIV